MVAVLAVQVREQEHQLKRQRPDKRSNPHPDYESASSTLSNSPGKIHRIDEADYHQSPGYVGAHFASSDAGPRQAWRRFGRAATGRQHPLNSNLRHYRFGNV